MALEIPLEVARRFILGKQGLWPGRRWQGLKGTEQALRAMDTLQLDPLAHRSQPRPDAAQPCARHRPADVGALAYQQRKFFDWGGWLAVRPMDELPHWRVVMRRERDRRWTREFAGQRARDRPSPKCELSCRAGYRQQPRLRDGYADPHANYRGRKDSALALYYLWRTGEAMTHHREHFERVYALTEPVAPRLPDSRE